MRKAKKPLSSQGQHDKEADQALQDRPMLREAKAFLQFFQLDSWERRLDEAILSGSPVFEFTA